MKLYIVTSYISKPDEQYLIEINNKYKYDNKCDEKYAN